MLSVALPTVEDVVVVVKSNEWSLGSGVSETGPTDAYVSDLRSQPAFAAGGRGFRYRQGRRQTSPSRSVSLNLSFWRVCLCRLC